MRNVFPARYLSVFVIGFLLFTQISASAQSSLANDVLTYTNKFRQSKGLTPLKQHKGLNEIAQKHSEDMASGKEDFGHNGFKKRGDKVRKIFASCTMAENVAYGATSGREVVDQWKQSSGHKKNMLGNYTYIGIGVAKDKRGRIYYTQLFVR